MDVAFLSRDLESFFLPFLYSGGEEDDPLVSDENASFDLGSWG